MNMCTRSRFSSASSYVTDEDWDLTERSTATTVTHRTDETMSLASQDTRLDESMSSVSHADMYYGAHEMMGGPMAAAAHLPQHHAMLMMAAHQRVVGAPQAFLHPVRQPDTAR